MMRRASRRRGFLGVLRLRAVSVRGARCFVPRRARGGWRPGRARQGRVDRGRADARGRAAPRRAPHRRRSTAGRRSTARRRGDRRRVRVSLPGLVLPHWVVWQLLRGLRMRARRLALRPGHGRLLGRELRQRGRCGPGVRDGRGLQWCRGDSDAMLLRAMDRLHGRRCGVRRWRSVRALRITGGGVLWRRRLHRSAVLR
jgi:hypothetical protein